MPNDVIAALQSLDVSNAVKQKISEVFSETSTDSWVKNLVTKSPFYMYLPASLQDSWLFSNLSNLMNNDDFAVAIFKNSLNSDINDYKFAVISSLDASNSSIAFMRQKDDGTLEGLVNDNTSSFLTTYVGYEYAFSFILNDSSIFPTFSIIDYESNNNESRTFSLSDIISYMNYCYESPLIETDEYKVNIFAIRSNYGFNDNGGEWQYEKRHQFWDYMLIFYREGSKWKLSQYDCTTFPDSEGRIRHTKEDENGKREFSHYSYYYPDHRVDKDRGMAILSPGQHIDAYKLGKHGSSPGYKALRQNSLIRHYRDRSTGQTGYYDFLLTSPTYTSKTRWSDHGKPWVNLHTNCPKSNSSGKVTVARSRGSEIGSYSMGCQVVALPVGNDWNDKIMAVFDQQEAQTGQNTFNYTIIEEWDFLQYMQIVNGQD